MSGIPEAIRVLGIVNRGETALRCLRTVKALRAREGSDLCALVLYTDVDRDAPFVRHADRAVELPAERGREARAYLEVERVLLALAAGGADAVWPGWGFLSEDPIFAERVNAAGLRFLGPSPAVLRALGDKVTAKRIAERVGVPVAPWSGSALTDVAAAAKHAEQIGFPLVLKAAAGGGGRGIRIVAEPGALAAAFASASAEAQSAFGDGRLFVERRVVGGRHVEVQIAADRHGTALALGLRDCSVQRRQQKLIEEAPPPNLSPERQAELAAAAERIAAGVGYQGLGTVEFLITPEEFFFLEVNPRLQVEHGVTEEVTGLDLVELQIRIARGEHLAGLAFETRGFAMEARLCAEDADAGFLPAPGRVVRFDPALGPGMRLDTGVSVGSSVPAAFDSLVAKVIASGSTREEARARLAAALADLEVVIEGGATNKGFLLELLETPELRAGGVDTAWVERWQAARSGSDEGAAEALVAAAILVYQRNRYDARLNFFADPTATLPSRVPPSLGQRIDLSYRGQSYRLEVFAIGSWQYRVHLDGRVGSATLREDGSRGARMSLGGRALRVLYDASEAGMRLEVEGLPYRFGWQSAGHVRAASPAMVVAVHVAPGDEVHEGDPLGLLEAMKTEIAFRAPVAGRVAEVRVRRGQKVAAGDVLVVIEPAAQAARPADGGARVRLLQQSDPLERFFRSEENGAPPVDLRAADRADPASRRAAVGAAREEIRRVLLGYDVDADRGERLLGFLEAPLPEGLSDAFLWELAAVRREVIAFADVEQLFVRSPRASVSGEQGPSNYARLRMYVRRLRAGGAGIAEPFLGLVRRALAHYDIDGLEPSDALERAVLRLLASQRTPELRRRLVLGILRRVVDLARAGVHLGEDEPLADALARIAGMRGLVRDALADAAIEARYELFESPSVLRAVERTTKRVEGWLSLAEAESVPPPEDVLVRLASAPRAIFDRIGRLAADREPRRRVIALAAHLRRLYVPSTRVARVGGRSVDTGVERLMLGDGRFVLGAAAGVNEALATADKLIAVAASDERLRTRDGADALELFVSDAPDAGAREAVLAELEATLSRRPPGRRFTVTWLGGDEEHHDTFEREDGGFVRRTDLCGLHPETAARIDLARLRGFELERLSGGEDVYCFHGRHRDVPSDERLFVLADVRGRSPEEGREAALHMPAFERAFHESTLRLRSLLGLRDPRRRLHWNRITLFVAPEVFLEPRTAEELSRKLAPDTRHLGLEKVVVRLKLLDRNAPEKPAEVVEIVIADPSGSQMEIAWRAPRRELLQPATDTERRLMDARRRALVYPYEVLRLLAGEPAGDLRVGESAATPLPRGRFEEWDVAGDARAAVPVPERAPGGNVSSVVFGILTTPTAKVPEGMRRVVILSDPTRGMGALGPAECDRLVAAIDLAERQRLPVEWIPVSSGARIAMDSGTENLDATARVVRRIVTFTQAGGVIHVIVHGVNVGAQSYFDALSTMLMHTRGTLTMTPGGSMVLTGRAALEASGSVSGEDEAAIGGFERVMGPNGEAHYFAHDLVGAYQTLYEHYRYTYVVPGEAAPRRRATTDPVDRDVTAEPYGEDDGLGFATVGEIFDDQANPGRKRSFSMRALMRAVADQDGGQLERWRSWVGAETAVVWDVHLGGYPACLIGIESRNVPRLGYRAADGPDSWTGGTLFPLSSKKVARALNAASANRPVVLLANLSGFDGSPESMRKLQLEYGAEIARAVVNFQGPIVFLVVSRYHGGAYVVFSRSLNASLRAAALEGSYASVIGGGPAAAVVFGREVQARAGADPRVVRLREATRAEPTPEARETYDRIFREVMLEKQAELAAEFDSVHTVERALAVGSLERIVSAKALRPFLIQTLEAALAAPSR